MSMVLYIFLYRFTCHFVSNGSDKISIFPKFSTPKFFLDLWMSQEDLFCAHTFQNSHRLTDRILRGYRCKYMYMIFRYFHLFYFTVSRCQYLFKQFFYTISHLISQYPLAILGCPNKVISCVVHCMAHSFNSHAVHYTTFLKKGNPFLPVLPHGVSRVSFS
jgi:hypothetical protein